MVETEMHGSRITKFYTSQFYFWIVYSLCNFWPLKHNYPTHACTIGFPFFRNTKASNAEGAL
ncbi:hypothetical protein MTR_4g021465 [Medicago truncatula]|uniref:Uncharacterized protein n=1 Tax=Medicago truncatula TaxID=3880 RepID=A0A072UHW6_MEDTR|nr:hypothetical protein MTR_4g021465 [Medicago truncatula]